jgi:hypothetical protein
MAVVTLPTTPRPASIAWEQTDFGGVQQSSLGGTAQRVNRMGNRWKAAITLPPMEATDANTWAAALSKGLRLGVAFQVTQPGVTIGSPGTPLVFGASQAGYDLDIDGLVPGYQIGVGRWLSVTTGGQRYLYQAAAAATAGASGRATVEIEPMIRVSPADNSPVDLVTPHIEGLLEVPQGWQIDTDWLVRGFAFAISETR